MSFIVRQDKSKIIKTGEIWHRTLTPELRIFHNVSPLELIAVKAKYIPLERKVKEKSQGKYKTLNR